MKIESKELQEVLKDLPQGNFMVAGGACLSLAQKSMGIYSTYGDIDLFFETEEELLKLVECFNFPIEMETANAISFPFDDLNIQLIKIFKPFETTIDDFDIDNSKFWSFYPFSEIETNQTYHELEFLKLTSPPSMQRTKRVLKYNQSKKINIDAFIPMLYQELVDYRFQDYTSCLYTHQEVITTKQKEKFISHILYSLMLMPKFVEYAKIQEELGKYLPFHCFSEDYFITMSFPLELKTAAYFYDKSYEDWFIDKFPEYVL